MPENRQTLKQQVPPTIDTPPLSSVGVDVGRLEEGFMSDNMQPSSAAVADTLRAHIDDLMQAATSCQQPSWLVVARLRSDATWVDANCFPPNIEIPLTNQAENDVVIRFQNASHLSLSHDEWLAAIDQWAVLNKSGLGSITLYMPDRNR